MTDELPNQAATAAKGITMTSTQGDGLREIIESLADGIVIVDPAGAIRFANPAAGRLFNRAPDELVGTVLGSALVAGETTEMEIVRRGGGTVLHAELRVVKARWEGELVDLVSLRDTTDRRIALERTNQLAHEREARIQAESASRTKSDFLAIMSHELRTPLNAILGYSELIELGISGDINPAMRDQIVRIRLCAKHLLALVNDILDLAKVDAGRLTIAGAPAMVADAVRAAVTLIQPQATGKNLRIVVVPGAEKLPGYIGDSERVTQVLVNLLSNAVKCTDPGGTITIESTVTAETAPEARLPVRGAYLRIDVTDTGSGIPADKLTAIFEPFVQVESGTTRTREGSGVGLTIGQRLARAMGGDLTVHSTVGQGSTFNLWIPADVTAEMSAAKESTEPVVVTTPAVAVNLHGLVDVARGILVELEPLVSGVVARIRCDECMPMAAGLRTSQLTDHLGTLLADIAGALIVYEEVNGEPSPLLADAMEIQRLVAERHGAQRARLGWKEAAFRREFMIIREDIERVVKRALPANGQLRFGDAMVSVHRFLDQAEYIGMRALEKDGPR